jgi:hypothetical protein
MSSVCCERHTLAVTTIVKDKVLATTARRAPAGPIKTQSVFPGSCGSLATLTATLRASSWEEVLFWAVALAIFIFAGGVMIFTSHFRWV